MTHRVVAGDLAIEVSQSGLDLSSTSNPLNQIHLDRSQIFKLFEVLAGYSPKADQNRRELFRVPLYGSAALQVQIAAHLKIIPALPINISISGMMLEVNSTDVSIETGDVVIVDLECGGFRYRGKADVSWCEGDTIGVWFHDCLNLDDPMPPQDLVEIVMKLQRAWLTRRQQFAD